MYISGEEMTAYTMQLIRRQWIEPHIDTSAWQMFDLSCRARDASEDQVLHDAVAAGRKMCAIFKEPTVTPTEVQKVRLCRVTGRGSHVHSCCVTAAHHPPLTLLFLCFTLTDCLDFSVFFSFPFVFLCFPARTLCCF